VILTLKRTIFSDLSTIGELSIDGKFECFILEDRDRGLDSSQTLDEIKSVKITAQTAIPTGKYSVIYTMSRRFGRMLPLLANVPGYDGIRIHAGNSPVDTEGCLLPGKRAEKDFVTDSRLAFNLLLDKITLPMLDRSLVIEVTRDEERWKTFNSHPN
jgi:hypothetical protein